MLERKTPGALQNDDSAPLVPGAAPGGSSPSVPAPPTLVAATHHYTLQFLLAVITKPCKDKQEDTP
jgi:hypothetical protein